MMATGRKTGRGPRIALLPAAGLGLIAALAFDKITDDAPAFNSDLRHQTVFGDWRLDAGSAHFDQSAYAFHVGYGYLRGDVAALIMGEDEVPTPDAFEIGLERACALFRRSVTLAPGHVDAWTGLAWCNFLLGLDDESVVALKASWTLAPFNVGEAGERLELVAGLDAVYGRDLSEDAEVAPALARDERVLRAYDAGFFELWPGANERS